jgi:hypothetical protein
MMCLDDPSYARLNYDPEGEIGTFDFLSWNQGDWEIWLAKNCSLN